jgi:hypothetical protein
MRASSHPRFPGLFIYASLSSSGLSTDRFFCNALIISTARVERGLKEHLKGFGELEVSWSDLKVEPGD